MPASALSNAIRFVGEKDEEDIAGEKGMRKRERERERGKEEKLLELSVINTLNFFPGRAGSHALARLLNVNDRNRSLI